MWSFFCSHGSLLFFSHSICGKFYGLWRCLAGCGEETWRVDDGVRSNLSQDMGTSTGVLSAEANQLEASDCEH
jgi:hypothetical protein